MGSLRSDYEAVFRTERCRASTAIAAVLPAAALIIALAGCRAAPRPGVADLPPLPRFEPGVYTDINPRWSHDGAHVAFLRSTPDRRLQLFLADGDLDRTSALLESELVSPDRPYAPQQCRYASPDTIAWSPDDSHIAFERSEWFEFDDGQRLPGTGIWSFELHSGRVSALALHPRKYSNLYYYYHSPAWSPDGAYVAFIAEGISGQRLLGLRCLSGQKPKEVVPRFDNYALSDWPVWRPPVHQSGAAGPRRLHRPILTYCQGILRTSSVPITSTVRSIQPGSAAGVECRELWRITPARYRSKSAPPRGTELGHVVEPRLAHPAWSPDGRRLAFTVSPDANDLSRYEIWSLDVATGAARRVSPADGRGYLAPEWIDGARLGALSPSADRFRVVLIDILRGTKRDLGSIDTADYDWSPDHNRIIYATAAVDTPNSPDEPTTLRVLETNIKAERKRH